MRFRPRTIIAAVAVLGTATAVAAFTIPASADDNGEQVTESHEVFSPNGDIDRKKVTREVKDDPAPRSTVRKAEVVPILDNGPTEEKLDIVVVGDGYTEADMATYEEHTRSKMDEVFAVEPFKSYKDQFNVWMVKVVSKESGVDHDPQGTLRDTALDMEFWCGDTERLLCVNTTKAKQYAAEAPDVDQVLALGNSTKYGGAGYPSEDVGTSSGGNEQAGQVVVHEFGHSIGDLADEYTYGGGDTYTGPEVGEVNASIKDRATQESEKVKWHQWMGEETPDGGTIDTYDGCRYYEHGIFRPSDNSIMRELGREFNLPGREAMIGAFHDSAAVASPTVPTKQKVAVGEELGLELPDVHGDHTIEWKVDGKVVKSASGKTSLDTGGLKLDSGKHEVSVTVTDTTDWVRDEKLRADNLTDTFTWTVA